MIVTRFAPTISGRLHLGSLYNALANYIYAKRSDGTFFLRLDGVGLTPARETFQRQILEDLETFGLVPDFVVKQSDRRDLYRRKVEDLISQGKAYFCNCSVKDIIQRVLAGSDVVFMRRDEKYPPPMGVIQIKVLDERGQDMTHKANLSASHGKIESVLNPDRSDFWQPFGIGYMRERNHIHILFHFPEPILLQSIEITYKDYPWQKWSVYANGRQAVLVERFNKFCHPDYPLRCSDSVSFAPIECNDLEIRPLDFMLPTQREYMYDGYCRKRGLRLNLDDDHTVVRCISKNKSTPDVVLWIHGIVDLSLSSAIDDKEFGVTHSIRGIDIEPFTRLEKEAARLIGYHPNNIFHGEVLTPGFYKYSKFIRSQPATSYLSEVFPDTLLSYLIGRGNINKRRSLKKLVRDFPLFTIQNFVIDEKEMIRVCKEV